MNTNQGPERAVLTALLRHFDWSPKTGVPSLYEVWQGEDSSLEVLVPLDPERGDFSALVERAKRQLLSTYGPSAQRVESTLTMRAKASLDATEWRKQTALDGGLIGWEQGEDLFAAARAQLVAAAKSAREPRKYHGNASAHIAHRFIEQALMGQTSVGSYVVTAYTPAQAKFFLTRKAEERASEAGGLWDDSLSGREILDKLSSALKAMRSGLDEYRKSPSLGPFLEAVPDGISYELVKALDLIVSTGDTEVAISREEPEGATNLRTEVAFESSEAPVMRSVAVALAEDAEPADVSIVGEVTLLSRTHDQTDHVIRVDIEHGAEARKARVRLSPEQYDVALEAHRQDVPIRVSGRLEREGHLYWLYDASDVTVVSDASDSSDATSSPEQPTLPEETE